MSEENGIAIRENREVAIARYVTPVGLEGLPDDLEQERWADLLAAAKNYADAQYWIAGDLANFGEAHYGEAYTQFVEVMGYDPGTLTAAMYVARVIPFNERRPELSWSCHQVVAGIKDPEQRKAWLGLAAENKWTREELRTNLRETQGREKKKGAPRRSKQAKARASKITEKDFVRLANKELEPALNKGIDHCRKFIEAAQGLIDGLDKGTANQESCNALAVVIAGFGEDLGPLGRVLVEARDIVLALATYDPDEAPKKGRPKGAKTKKTPKAAKKAHIDDTQKDAGAAAE